MDYELDRLKQVLESKIKGTRNDINHELYNDIMLKHIGIHYNVLADIHYSIFRKKKKKLLW